MSEVEKRYKEAKKLLKRCRAALLRSGWEEGESDGEVLHDVMEFLTNEKLEKTLFKKQPKGAE